MDFQSQKDIYNPENQEVSIHIIGAGSTGSFIALTLAKMGINKIWVYDFDKVEEKNIPNQFYRLKDIKQLKVDALKDIIKEFTGTEVSAENIKVKYSSIPAIMDLGSIVIFCVDNMESRKDIYKALKEIPIKIIDTRLGGEGYQIYAIDLLDDKQKEYYEKTLETETLDAPCGQKSVIYTILSLASEVCNIVKKIDKKEIYPIVVKREMRTYKILTDQNDD